MSTFHIEVPQKVTVQYDNMRGSTRQRPSGKEALIAHVGHERLFQLTTTTAASRLVSPDLAVHTLDLCANNSAHQLPSSVSELRQGGGTQANKAGTSPQ